MHRLRTDVYLDQRRPTFFREKGLRNPFKRCKLCKKNKNARIESVRNRQAKKGHQRIEVNIVCANCGQNTTVPFYPPQGRPGYFRSCVLSINPGTNSNRERPVLPGFAIPIHRHEHLAAYPDLARLVSKFPASRVRYLLLQIGHT